MAMDTPGDLYGRTTRENTNRSGMVGQGAVYVRVHMYVHVVLTSHACIEHETMLCVHVWSIHVHILRSV